MGNQRQLQNPTRHAQSEAARLAAQRKMYCVWFVAVVVPFAILFCLFPSSSNRNSHKTSRFPASAKTRLVSGDNAFRQQVIVEDSFLNPLEQEDSVESLASKLGGKSPDRKQKSHVEGEPEEVRSAVGIKSPIREGYHMGTTKSEMQGRVADDWKKKRPNENVNRKSPTKGLEDLTVETLDERGSIFGPSEDMDRLSGSRRSQEPKQFSADLLQSSDTARGKSESFRTASKKSPASGGLQKKKGPSDNLQRISDKADAASKMILRPRSTPTGSQQKVGRTSNEFSRQKQWSTDRQSELNLPEVVRKEEKPEVRNSASVECDISKGKWIPDNSGPRYANASCPWIDEVSQKWMEASILDAKYPQWRWKPDGCTLKRFNAKAFLKTMERKAMAFVGDSLARGQARSLLCLLARAESPKSISVAKENQSASWHFSSSNFTLMIVWSPYLVQETQDYINGAPDGVKKVRLDVVDPTWARLLLKLDAVVLSVGSWFRGPVAYVVKNQMVGCHGCGSAVGVKELGLYSAYRAAWRSAIIGVTTLPWYTGTTVLQQTIMEKPGSCEMMSNSSSRYRESRNRTEELSKKVSQILRDEFERALKRGIPNGSRLQLSETTKLTFQHPAVNSTLVGTVRTPTSFAGNKDFYCAFLHGCLAGPSLAWNQLLQRNLRRPSIDVVTL